MSGGGGPQSLKCQLHAAGESLNWPLFSVLCLVFIGGGRRERLTLKRRRPRRPEEELRPGKENPTPELSFYCAGIQSPKTLRSTVAARFYQPSSGPKK